MAEVILLICLGTLEAVFRRFTVAGVVVMVMRVHLM